MTKNIESGGKATALDLPNRAGRRMPLVTCTAVWVIGFGLIAWLPESGSFATALQKKDHPRLDGLLCFVSPSSQQTTSFSSCRRLRLPSWPSSSSWGPAWWRALLGMPKTLSPSFQRSSSFRRLRRSARVMTLRALFARHALWGFCLKSSDFPQVKIQRSRGQILGDLAIVSKGHRPHFSSKNEPAHLWERGKVTLTVQNPGRKLEKLANFVGNLTVPGKIASRFWGNVIQLTRFDSFFVPQFLVGSSSPSDKKWEHKKAHSLTF